MPNRNSDSYIDWQPESWQQKKAAQQPVYTNSEALRAVIAQLSKLPPLVTGWEIEILKRQLAEVAMGERFLLQGGDCSESFLDCEPGVIIAKLKILLQMSIVLVHGGMKPITRVGRFAGQYAKPRSADTETQHGVTLPTYRGDMINHSDFNAHARTPDPILLLRGYERAGLTINFIRAQVAGGLADLHHPEFWELGFVRNSPLADEYIRRLQLIRESLCFMETLVGSRINKTDRADFFTSHEGLHLFYEQSQTRQESHRQEWYNLGAHFPWIGNRTRTINGAHVEYFRGIQNPIGVKIGPAITPEEVLLLCDVLNPHNDPGRLTLIHRFGADRIASCLPPIVDAVRRNNRSVIWCCDPMHGNTEKTSSGIKTRRFNKIAAELEASFRILADCGGHLGGIHLELTGEKVTECLGGASGVKEKDLDLAYKTQVDPRLNYEQAMEIAFLLADVMARKPC